MLFTLAILHIRGLIDEFLAWHISGVARCNLTFSSESLSFFSITVLRMFWCTTIIWICFSTPIETPPKHGFWKLQLHLLATKIVVRDVRRIPCFGRSKRRWLEPMYESSHCFGVQWIVFSCSIFEFIRRQIVVFHSELTVLRRSSGTVATWQVLLKKHANICLEVIFSQTTSVGFGSGSKTHTMVSYAQIHDSSAVTIL